MKIETTTERTVCLAATEIIPANQNCPGTSAVIHARTHTTTRTHAPYTRDLIPKASRDFQRGNKSVL